MRDENENKKKFYKTKRKDDYKRKGIKNGAALGRRLSQWLRDMENKKEEEQKKSEKKEEETRKDSDTNSSATDVVEWKSEVKIEYTERRVVMSGKKKKTKKYGVVLKSFILHKKRKGNTNVGRKNVMRFLIQYRTEVNTLEKNTE